MTKYREAAHAAFQAVDQQEALLPCKVSANNLVYQFLLEVRKVLQNSAQDGGRTSYLPSVLKKAADHVKEHPLRIYDADSAKVVPHIGPDVANMIMKHLFSQYPPEVPSFEEAEERRAIEASLRKQQAKKRKAPQETKRESHAVPGGQTGNQEENLAAGALRTKSNHKEPKEKQPKEYIPKVGTANYAFLIVLLQATKGPEKRMYLTKQEMMERAEASGLADISIFGEGSTIPVRGAVNPSQYYNGWSGFNSQLVNAHRLVNVSSNPKKCELMPRGLDLAERLYRDAVQRGKMGPIPGIPTSGEWLFQSKDDPVLCKLKCDSNPSFLAGPRDLTAAVHDPAEARLLLRDVNCRSHVPEQSTLEPPQAPAAATAAAGLQRSAGRRCNAHGVMSGSYLSGRTVNQLTKSGPRTGAVAIADALAEAGLRPEPPGLQAHRESIHYSLKEIKIPARGLSKVSQNASQSAAASKQGRELRNIGTAIAVGGGEVAELQVCASMSTHRLHLEPRTEVINLLDDADELCPLADRLAGRYAAATRKEAFTHTDFDHGVMEGEADDHACAVDSCDDVEADVLIEMGYKSKCARKALRRSMDFNQALDLLQTCGSISESDSEANQANFHDAQEGFPGGKAPALHQQGVLPETRSGSSSLQPQRQPPGRSGPPAPAKRGINPRPVQNSQGLQLDDVLGGLQGLGSRPARLGHIRQGTQQAGSSRAWLGSQQRDGSQLWASNGSQPDNESQPAVQMQDCTGLGEGSSATVVKQGTAQQSLQTGCGLPMGDLGGSVRQREEHIRLPPISSGRSFRDEYEVVLLVDGREQFSRCGLNGKKLSLADHLGSMSLAGMRVEREKLQIGDAVWVARSRSDPAVRYVLDFIVERKSVEDLIQSIRSHGRYEKQKLGLRKCGLRHVKYLLEGDPDLLPTAVEQKTVKTALAQVEVFDRFQVLRTRGHQQTFKLYQALTASIERLYNPLRANSAPGAPRFEDWASHMERVRKQDTTLHDVWGLMLTAVPGLGPEAVQIILQHYPTPHALYMRYRQVLASGELEGIDPQLAAERLLEGLRRADGVRSIGLDKSQKVYKMLFASM